METRAWCCDNWGTIIYKARAYVREIRIIKRFILLLTLLTLIPLLTETLPYIYLGSYENYLKVRTIL